VSVEFGASYAGHYDALYADKNYAGECDAVEALIRRHASGAVHTVLDLGCGTGRHAFVLADRGYAVTGVDRSAAMLNRARAKATERREGAVPEFLLGDVRAVHTGRTYDAVTMLFSVLGYQTGDDDLAAALRTAREHLRAGGVFICDVWFGPAVLAIGPSQRTKVSEDGDATLTRSASGQLDAMKHTCRVDVHSTLSRGGRVVEEATEAHVLRYFFLNELESAFAAQGLELCAVCPFDDLDATPGPGSWNVWVCARG
jgi:SAM-dependent methyltransferase